MRAQLSSHGAYSPLVVSGNVVPEVPADASSVVPSDVVLDVPVDALSVVPFVALAVPAPVLEADADPALVPSSSPPQAVDSGSTHI
jgi:hypothetical protein